MKSNKQQVILITGASQGIGFTLAEKFALLGYRVIGVARTLPKQGGHFDAQIMDVTNRESVEKIFAHIRTNYQRLDVLINNAGFGIGGAIEDTPLEMVKTLFDVNVFGLHQTTQVMLPMLKNTQGIIINIGSVAGDFTIPFQGFYSMTKASVATYSEALRQELKPFKVRVVNVKPGDTKSNFSQKRQTILPQKSLYTERVKRSIAVMEKDEKQGLPASSVFRVCRRIIKQKNPPLAVTVGIQYQILQLLKWLLPKRLVQWLLYQMYAK
jgi:short-subunit dehydrogenase